MKDLSKEMLAYALHNAVEHGKANIQRVLPKLFQHGLEKHQIKEIMPLLTEVINAVNKMKPAEREKELTDMKHLIKQREEPQEKKLPELPEATQSMVFRLAPFPSGALHIGNAKTYILNALYAEKYKAKTILVMDDTIGSSEKPLTPDAYKLIEDAFNWLNITYKQPIVYKSDRLKLYYTYAEKLIHKNKAYVCHCEQETLRENRAKGIECSCRQYPPGIQLERWKEMFKAKEGHAILRIKTDMQHPNPAFRDRVLFKISDRTHPRVGNKYRVWPSLEMSWAIDDHDLGITHIIRGNDLMMETEMEQYIWNIFNWKHPQTIHTGLVRIEGLGAKISKSKAQKEVLSGEFTGWDDPRTWSIQSLERRGIQPLALRDFVEDLGLNKQDITVPVETLYSLNRALIDEDTKRYYFVKDPMRITVQNNLKLNNIEVPIHPDKPHETREVKVTDTLFIAKEDYETLKGTEIRLLHLFNVKLAEKTTITSIENKKIPKIQWVCGGAATRILMPDGTWINGVAEDGVTHLTKGEVIQFERFGFVRYTHRQKGIYYFSYAHK